MPDAALAGSGAALEDIAQLLRLVLSTGAIIVSVCDRERRYTSISSRDPQVPVGPVIGRRDEEIFPPEEVAELVAFKQAALERGTPLRREITTHIGGRRQLIEIAAEPLRDASGAVAGLRCVGVDVTARRDTEDRFREREAAARATFENAAVGIGRVALDGRWLEVNERLLEITGHPRERLLQGTFADITHPEDVDADWAHARALLAGVLSTYTLQKRYLRPDGGTVWVDLTVSLVHGEEGLPAYFIAVVQDITERKRAEDVLKRADRQKDEFLATLAHELRNPLAPIRTAVHLLASPQLTAAHRERVRAMIERQVAAMTRLVDDLLEVSRLTLGRIELRREPVGLALAINQALEAAGPAIRAGAHELEVDVPEEPILVLADLVRLAQVITNLLTNAARYTPPGGGIRVSAAIEDGQALVRVCDDGIGIAAESLERIFEMFTQVDQRGRSEQGGLGIGLAIARRLVELHGGTLVAASAGPGRGAEFTVRMPLALEAEYAATSPPERARPASVRRVLVVDDNVDAAESLAMLLAVQGHESRMVHSGEAALEAIAGEPRFDVVLLDIGLPGIDGYEVARRIRARFDAAAPLLVALTGWGQESDREHSAAAGFDRHLTKPADPVALSRLVEESPPGAAR